MVNINATRDTILAVTSALALARALDNRIGEVNELRIAAWSEVVDQYGLSKDDMLAGVRAHYAANDANSLLVGDLLYHARLHRKDRTEREDSATQAARMVAHEVKAAPEIAALAASKSVEEALKYRRPTRNPLLVPCPHPPCHAGKGMHCKTPTGEWLRRAEGRCHPTRLQALDAYLREANR